LGGAAAKQTARARSSFVDVAVETDPRSACPYGGGCRCRQRLGAGVATGIHVHIFFYLSLFRSSIAVSLLLVAGFVAEISRHDPRTHAANGALRSCFVLN